MVSQKEMWRHGLTLNCGTIGRILREARTAGTVAATILLGIARQEASLLQDQLKRGSVLGSAELLRKFPATCPGDLELLDQRSVASRLGFWLDCRSAHSGSRAGLDRQPCTPGSSRTRGRHSGKVSCGSGCSGSGVQLSHGRAGM